MRMSDNTGSSKIGRDGVFSTWYGRKRSYRSDFNVMKSEKGVMEGTENCGKGEIHAVLVANGTIDVSFL